MSKKRESNTVVLDVTKVRTRAKECGLNTKSQLYREYRRICNIPDGQEDLASNKAWDGESMKVKFANNVALTLGLSSYLELMSNLSFSPWSELLHEKEHSEDFVNFRLTSEGDCGMFSFVEDERYDRKQLQQVNINDRFFIEVKGSASQAFLAILQSDDSSWQLAPIDRPECDSTLLGMDKPRCYPSKDGVGFKKEYGLGWRRIVVIKSTSIPRYATGEDRGYLVTPAELDSIALYFQTKDFTYSVYTHEFNLIS